MSKAIPKPVTKLMAAVPVCILLVLVLAIGITYPPNDLVRFFIPAGDLLTQGLSPYVLNQTQPFIYLPFSLWVFPVISNIPYSYWVILAVNTLLLLFITWRLTLPKWWYLYPAALYVIVAGQLDLFVFCLALEAFKRKNSPVSAILMTLGLAIKPQVALFWIMPLIYGLETASKRIKYCLTCIVLLGLPMLIYFLIQPDFATLLWNDWAIAVRSGAGAYVGDSPSFWAIGLIPLALASLILWVVFGRDQHLARPFLALGLPTLRYYSSVGLFGAAPIWGIALAYGVVVLTLVFKLPLLWAEPLIIAFYYLWRNYKIYRSKKQSLSGLRVGHT